MTPASEGGEGEQALTGVKKAEDICGIKRALMCEM